MTRLTSTWLMFVCLGIASFAPVVVGLRPGWWALYYYGALLVGWLVLSVATVRRAAREEEKTEYELERAERQLRAARNAEAAETYAAAARRPLAEERLIIVTRDDVGLYDRLRRDQAGDEAVMIITDRRSTDRRRQLEVYIPDRRSAERRRNDIASLLLAQGWAEVMSPKE
jgi:hypothetical protein